MRDCLLHGSLEQCVQQTRKKKRCLVELFHFSTEQLTKRETSSLESLSPLRSFGLQKPDANALCDMEIVSAASCTAEGACFARCDGCEMS